MSPRPHFLSVLLGKHQDAHVLMNQRTGQVVAAQIELTLDSKSRRRGLLGRDSLAEDTVMIIAPCNAIHMFFMRFTIDVVFVNREGLIVKLHRHVRPWRIAVALGSFAALEFAEGAVDRSGLAKGDRLEVVRKSDSKQY